MTWKKTNNYNWAGGGMNLVELTSDKWIKGDGSYAYALIDLRCNRLELYCIASQDESEGEITVYLEDMINTDTFIIDQNKNIDSKVYQFCDKVCSFFCDDVEEINKKRLQLISEGKDYSKYQRIISKALPSITKEDEKRLKEWADKMNDKFKKSDKEVKDILEDTNIDSGDYTYDPVVNKDNKNN